MTTTPEIRPIRSDELPGFFDVLRTSFLERIDVERVAEEVRPHWDLERTLGAFDNGKVVGTFRSWETEITVPGGARLPAAAITAVSVLPTHRRRGLLRAMTAADHAADRQRGEAMALLYAAEYPIYGRFGYGPATTTATWTLDTHATGFIDGPTGSVELVKPDDDAAAKLGQVFEAWRAVSTSEIRRREYRWRFDLGLEDSGWGERWKGYLALHRNHVGAVDGFVRYTAEQKWEQGQPRGIINVNELHALTDEGHGALWQFLSGIDWAANVKAEGRRLAERLPWILTNARAARASEAGDGLWVRLFDLPRALSSRTYEREGKLVLDVIDNEVSGGRVRVSLDTGGGGATSRRTEATPDLTLDVSALSAAYLGGTRLADAVRARGVDEHRTGALREADALFRTADEPWCSTFF